MTGTLRVTPQELVNGAREFENVASQINSIANRMISEVQALNGVWQGPAQQAYWNKFQQNRQDMNDINSKVREHSNDLQQMGNNYSTSENTNVNSINRLKTDVVH